MIAMEESTDNLKRLAATSKHLAGRLLTMGENRLELLTVELQEERERVLRALLLALALAVFGLLTGMTLTAAIVFWLPQYPPAVVLLVLTGVYAAVGLILCWRLVRLLRDWHMLSASLDQFRKDRACLEKIFS
jgi:uncharacterized membrane protein YqjE